MIHKKIIKPVAHVSLNIVDIRRVTDTVSIHIINPNGTIEKRKDNSIPLREPGKENTVKQEWQWYFDDFQDKDVITLCK